MTFKLKIMITDILFHVDALKLIGLGIVLLVGIFFGGLILYTKIERWWRRKKFVGRFSQIKFGTPPQKQK